MVESEFDCFNCTNDDIDSEMSSTEVDDAMDAIRSDTLTLTTPVKLDAYRIEFSLFIESLGRDSIRTERFKAIYLDAEPRAYKIWILRDDVLDFPRAMAIYHVVSDSTNIAGKTTASQRAVLDEWLCDVRGEFETLAKERFSKSTQSDM